jgi:hypothetical protein
MSRPIAPTKVPLKTNNFFPPKRTKTETTNIEQGYRIIVVLFWRESVNLQLWQSPTIQNQDGG